MKPCGTSGKLKAVWFCEMKLRGELVKHAAGIGFHLDNG